LRVYGWDVAAHGCAPLHGNQQGEGLSLQRGITSGGVVSDAARHPESFVYRTIDAESSNATVGESTRRIFR
jgi:hypothetical protein